MDLAILLDEAISTPLHQQLYEALRQAVLTGKLIPGERLPSTRTLAKSLGISRGTAKLSYEQLLSEGYIETVMGSGTFVCQHIPEPSPLAMPPQPHCSGALATTGLSTYAQNFAHRALPKPSNRNPAIDFCYWQPAFDHFPLSIWRKLMTRRLQSPDSLDYSADLLGQKELRETIAHYLVRSRAVHCDAEQIVIVNGTQQALDLDF